MPSIRTCLWFDRRAEEAASFYCSIFERSRIVRTTHYGEGMPRPKGEVLTVEFELDGRPFMALNGGPQFPFTEAVSLVVDCADQAELDRVWAKLSEGGAEVECGWLKDRYGLSWQVVPAILAELISDKDPQKRDAVLHAIMGMKKLDVEALKRAAGRARA